MEFSGEARTFLSILLTGAVLGCIFDIYRVTRNTFKLRSFGTSVADILYWILAAAIVFIVLIAVNWGQVRFYVFIALVAGAAIYFWFFSRHTIIFLIRFIRFINKIQNMLRRILRAVFLKAIAKPASFIFKITFKPFRPAKLFLKRLCKKLLEPHPEDKV